LGKNKNKKKNNNNNNNNNNNKNNNGLNNKVLDPSILLQLSWSFIIMSWLAKTKHSFCLYSFLAVPTNSIVEIDCYV